LLFQAMEYVPVLSGAFLAAAFTAAVGLLDGLPGAALAGGIL
jgi:hypothetical protein